MNKSKNSLRRQFFNRLFLIMIATALLSGLVQLYFIRQQITRETNNQATMVAQSINKGIEETSVAAGAIEHQIDLKLVSYARHIADRLEGKNPEGISAEELKAIRDQLGLGGITLLIPKDGDIVGVASTEPQDIGFSVKKSGFLEAGQTLLGGGKADLPGATFLDNNIAVLPIAQSASHGDKPVFFKYSYYHPPGKNYVINVYIEANEVSQFIDSIGTDAWIAKVREENKNVLEIGVLTPEVFVDPSLEEKIYPPVKKIVHGKFDLRSGEDESILKKMADQPEKTISIQQINGKKIYKMFQPIPNGQVVYLSLDYGQLISPLYRHSIILIMSGFVSLVALFMLTASFFNRIYRHIQQLGAQIKLLEGRDFTARSHIPGKGELAGLSESANRMVSALNQLLKDTTDQATKVRRLSMLLEADANQSVEKVFVLSMETTASAREEVEEILDFLDQTERQLQLAPKSAELVSVLQRVDGIRQIARNRTQSATEITLTLSDLLKSLHAQSSELSEISRQLLLQMAKFKLN